MKIFSGIIILAISVFISYCVGYYEAVNDTVFMLSANSAKISMVTINYLEKGTLDKIKNIHRINAEASMSALEDTYSRKDKIQSFLTYHNAFSHNDEYGRQIIESLRPQYAQIAHRSQ